MPKRRRVFPWTGRLRSMMNQHIMEEGDWWPVWKVDPTYNRSSPFNFLEDEEDDQVNTHPGVAPGGGVR